MSVSTLQTANFPGKDGEAWLAGWRRAVSWSGRKIVGPVESKTSLEQRAKVHNLLATVTMGEIFIVTCIWGSNRESDTVWYRICHCTWGWFGVQLILIVILNANHFPFDHRIFSRPRGKDHSGNGLPACSGIDRHGSRKGDRQVDTLSWFILRGIAVVPGKRGWIAWIEQGRAARRRFPVRLRSASPGVSGFIVNAAGLRADLGWKASHVVRDQTTVRRNSIPTPARRPKPCSGMRPALPVTASGPRRSRSTSGSSTSTGTRSPSFPKTRSGPLTRPPTSSSCSWI